MVCCIQLSSYGAQVFSRALFKVNFKYSLGLSATVSRKDGLSKVFKWFLGDIVYKAKAKQSDDVNVLINISMSQNRSIVIFRYFIMVNQIYLN